MQKAFKFRIYPTRLHEGAMLGLLDAHRNLYNAALAERKDVFEQESRTINYGEQSAKLKWARANFPHLSVANFSSCQRTLKRLDRAFASFFRRVKSGEKPGYPRFRGRGGFNTIDFTHGDGAKALPGGRVYFQGVGDIKVKMHRDLEGMVKTAAFTLQAGRWYVVFVCDIPGVAVEPSTNPPAGIDMGLKSFLVGSDGTVVHPPGLYRKAQKKLRRLQRSVSRKVKGGLNRRKAVRRLSRHHYHVANQRRDFHHKTALSLVQRFGVVVHEDLNVKGLCRAMLSKSMHDAGWSQFLSILRYKAESAGVRVIAVDARYTTQTCSSCGCLPPEPIGLGVRMYSCIYCNFQCDRDLNAAYNILARARITARTGPLGVKPVNGLVGPRSLRLQA